MRPPESGRGGKSRCRVDWIETAKRLRSIAGEAWLPQRVKERIESAQNLYIACSGGADSVFLALYFAELRCKGALTVLHFNHKLRGGASDADERFVEELCSGMEVPLVSGNWDRKQGCETWSEESARDARMEFFAQSIGDSKDAALVLTGHHADDVAETLLMRLSRGSGLQGLSAPREISQGAHGLTFARPLLKLRKSEICAWLEEANAEWREDASNQTEEFYRNRIRKSVIPEWEKAADRAVIPGAIRSRELLEEDWIALEHVFDSAWEEIEIQEGELDWAILSVQTRAIQRRALNRLVLGCSETHLTTSVMDEALESIRSDIGFKFSVDEGKWIEGVPGKAVRLTKSLEKLSWKAQILPDGAVTFLPGGGRLWFRETSVSADIWREVQSGALPHDKIVYIALGEKQSARLRVRLWQPGDAYRPMGRESVIKLKELFIDRKIPREERGKIPIVSDESGNIVWVPGLPPCRERLLSGPTTRALQLTYEK